MPTQALVDAYLTHLEQDRHLASSTVAGYRAELAQLVKREVPLTSDGLARFVVFDGAGSPLAATTRNRRLVVVRGVVAYLVRTGALAEDPTAPIEHARIPRHAKAAITVHELRRVVDAIGAEPVSWRRTRDACIVVLLFQSGLRISELTGLDLDKVDLASSVLRSTRRKGGGQIDVPLNVEAVAALRAWLAVRPAEAIGPAVFVGGAPPHRLSVRLLQKRLATLGERAGLGMRLHPHALRHAHATALLRAGVATEIIRQSLNHASITTTQRYLHGDDELLRQALARMPPLCAGTTAPEEPKSGARSAAVMILRVRACARGSPSVGKGEPQRKGVGRSRARGSPTRAMMPAESPTT